MNVRLPSLPAVLLLLGCFFCSAPTSGVEFFGPGPAIFEVGSFPSSIAVGHLDGDGAVDLVVANSGGDSLTILSGDGSGGFQLGQEFAVGASPVSVEIADFDQDGSADLAVANFEDACVAVLLGDGTGRFVPASEVALAGQPTSVKSGDFNNDGTIDLAVALHDAGSISLLLGDGLGQFSESTEVAVGSHPFSITVDDLDDDGTADLVVANRSSNSISVLLGDGSGQISSTTETIVGIEPFAVAVGEFNGDGAKDLAVANYGSDTISILLGDGSGEFISGGEPDSTKLPEASIPITIRAPTFIVVSDFNKDTKADLAITSGSQGTMSVLLGDGSSRFNLTAEILVGDGPFSMAAGEFDGRPAPDIAVVSSFSSTVGVLLGDGAGGFSGTLDVQAGEGVRSVAVGDFDGDDREDLALPDFLSDKLALISGDGQAGFTQTAEIDTWVDPVAVAAGDFDGDGHTDLAIVNSPPSPSVGYVSIHLNGGDQGFDIAQIIEVGTRPGSIAVGRFNQDGNIDLAVANYLSSTVSILTGDGSGAFERVLDVSTGAGPNSIAAGDFNADGVADLAVALRQGDALEILHGTGTGGFAPSGELLPVADARSVTVGQFNGDGIDDLAVASYAEDAVVVASSSGGGGFELTRYTVDGARVVAAGDFNGDGTDDLAVSSFDDNSLIVLLGEGTGKFDQTLQLLVGPAQNAVVVGEFNSDGAFDIVVAKEESTSILLNQLRARADINGSNRIDGFDLSEIGRHAGLESDEPGYLRSADVDMSSLIDGDDLALVASRFGELYEEASPLRATLVGGAAAQADSVLFRQLASEGDRLDVEILVNDAGDPAAAADFAVAFEPTDQRSEQVLEVVGFEPGSYLSGRTGQIYSVNAGVPGRVEIRVVRFPTENVATPGEQPLMTLFFKARRAGNAGLDFVPYGSESPTLLDVDLQEVSSVSFVGGVDVKVEHAQPGGAPGQRIDVMPASLDFGQVSPGTMSVRTIRVTNYGFAELRVVDAAATPPEFTSFFTAPFAVQPFGFVELTVQFSPVSAGLFSGELVIESDDPDRQDTDGDGYGEVRIPLLGRSPQD